MCDINFLKKLKKYVMNCQKHVSNKWRARLQRLKVCRLLIQLFLQEDNNMKTKVSKVQKVVALMLSLVMILSCSLTSFAAEGEVAQDEREYLVVNGTDIVYVGDDYENPDTEEYVHWDTTARGTDKTFSFKVRYSLWC